MTDELVAIYTETTEAIILEGREWYPRTLELARAMAAETGHTETVACGVLAALSPRSFWATNVSVAWDMMRGGPGAGLTLSLANARAILDGADPLDILNGPKTRAFYGAIAGTGHTATVDAWAVQAATGREYGAVAPCRYDDVAAAYANAAEIVGENVHAMQAIAWVAVNASAQRAMAS
jgi:hypothetical protein